MKVRDIIHSIESVAPLALQESYDNSGVQVGDVDSDVNKVLLCIDITEEIIDEAIQLGVHFIVSHHPLLFKKLKSITGKTYIERVILKAIKNDICIYSSHTNLDSALGGVSFEMAKRLSLKKTQVLAPRENDLIKLRCFVPKDHLEQVQQALYKAGAGTIGDYDQCSYITEGIGTFTPNENAHPFIGNKGISHQESEYCVEVIFPQFLQNRVLKTLHESHPYEQPAYDLISLKNKWDYAGLGVVGELSQEMDEMSFLKLIKKEFKCNGIRYSHLRKKPIRRVALCGGAGSSLMSEAISSGADIFITSGIGYHDYFENDLSILLADIGHYESEQFTTTLIASIIKEKFPDFEILFTKVNTNPINYL